MKYLWRLRTRSRAGLMSSRCSTKAGRGPSPSEVTAPGTLAIAPRSPATASSSLTMDASPSPSPYDRALAMLHNGLCGEGGAVATNADEGARQTTFGSLRQIDDVGHIGEVVAGEGDEIRLPFSNHAVVVGVALDLQIQEPHGVLGPAGSLRH